MPWTRRVRVLAACLAAPPPSAPAKPAPEQPAAWADVVTLQVMADKSSEVFELTGGEARLDYDFTGDPDLRKNAGRCYLHVTAANMDGWTVAIQEKR